MDAPAFPAPTGRPLQGELFPWEHPWRTRFDRAFWKTVPETPGVYRFLDAAGAVLYVGTSVRLRARLAGWRHLAGERCGRRHRQLLARTAAIAWETAPDAVAARVAEADLIHRLRPPFNAEYGHPEASGHVVLGPSASGLHLSWLARPPAALPPGATCHGAFRRPAGPRALLACGRLAWWHAAGGATLDELPHRLVGSRLPGSVDLPLPAAARDAARLARLAADFWAGRSASWLHRIAGTGGERVARVRDAWLRRLLEDDRRHLETFHAAGPARLRSAGLEAPDGRALDLHRAATRLAMGETRA